MANSQEYSIQDYLVELLESDEELDNRCSTFEEACLLTTDAGVVLTTEGGTKFQLTIMEV